MKIHIIRHGDPDYSIDSLTEKGWREAELLSKRVAKMGIDDFYCSPLGRAKDTMKASCDITGKKGEILPWLEEFRGTIKTPGSGEVRRSWDISPSLWCDDKNCYDYENPKLPDALKSENYSAIFNETKEGIDKLLLSYGWKREGMCYVGGEDKSIALFCHFALGITIVSYLLGISPIVAQNNFFLAPTSVTTLVTETDNKGFSHFRASQIGDTSHLYIAGEPVSESGLYPEFEQ